MKDQKKSKFRFGILYIGWIAVYATWLVLQGILPVIYNYEVDAVTSMVGYLVAAVWFLILMATDHSSRKFLEMYRKLNREILDDWQEGIEIYQNMINDPDFLRRQLAELEDTKSQSDVGSNQE